MSPTEAHNAFYEVGPKVPKSGVKVCHRALGIVAWLHVQLHRCKVTRINLD